MKRALTLFFISAVCLVAAGSNPKVPDLATAASVDVWDLRISDMDAKPISIVDSNKVASLAKAIESAPGRWKKGSFTAPTGNTRFVFRRGSEVIAAIGLGDGFLVWGGGSDWEYKKITKELQAKLASLGQPTSPNHTMQRMRASCLAQSQFEYPRRLARPANGGRWAI